MQIKTQLQAALLGQALLLAANTQAGPPNSNYQFNTITLPDNIQLLAGPTDNDSLTGYYLDDLGFAHGFLWSKGILNELDAPGWADTIPSGINNAGVVIGNYDDTVTTYGFLYHIADQSWTQLPDIPGEPINSANSISANGMAVGAAYEGDFSNLHAEVGWIWDGASYSFFTLPGEDSFFPAAINSMGQVVGYYPNDPQNPFGGWHGFLKNGATITTIDAPVPGTTGTFPVGINNKGDIVGTYYGVYNGTFENHGFILHNGAFVTVDCPAASLTQVWGINDQGQLSGFALLPSGFLPFLATPSPGKP